MVLEASSMKIGTRITLSAAHFVQTTGGPCARLHGHNWDVEIEARGRTGGDGMVADFREIKGVLNQYDHTFLVPEKLLTPVDGRFEIETSYGNMLIPVELVTHVPVDVITAENLAEFFRKHLEKIFGHTFIVRVWESKHSFAED